VLEHFPASVLPSTTAASITVRKTESGKAEVPCALSHRPVTDATLYSDMKKLVNSIFPYFDTKALDAARFFFGTQEPNVELYPGRMNLTEFLNDDEFDAGCPAVLKRRTVIPEGSRNATMSRFAGIVIKKYGDTEKAYQAFWKRPRPACRRWITVSFHHLAQRPALLFQDQQAGRVCPSGSL
jgi:hypothetical protein